MSVIALHSGAVIDLLEPDSSAITIQDVAVALSKICRFTGHCRAFYGVAQHSMLVAEILRSLGRPTAVQLLGLLHDAHEALMGDLSQPLKIALDECGGGLAVRSLDELLAERVRVALLPDEARELWAHADVRAAVQRADLIALATERRDLLPANLPPWPCLDGIEPGPVRIFAREWWAVQPDFLRMYHSLRDDVLADE